MARKSIPQSKRKVVYKKIMKVFVCILTTLSILLIMYGDASNTIPEWVCSLSMAYIIGLMISCLMTEVVPESLDDEPDLKTEEQ